VCDIRKYLYRKLVILKLSNPEKNQQKKEAALRAVDQVKSGQRVGLGTGSTAAFAIEELGRRKREEGLDILCVVTSYQSQTLALQYGLNILPLSAVDRLDISIDGCDEIDADFCLIKGGGGAHTVEKIVHAMSECFIVISDSSKRVKRLGEKFAVPVEIIPSALSFVQKELLRLGSSEAILRAAINKDGPIITDSGNFILDARFFIKDPFKLEREIKSIPGVIENGIFASEEVKPFISIISGDNGLEINRNER